VPNWVGILIRPELSVLWDKVFMHKIDSNRAVIELIKAHAKRNDEILVNYKDIPFMFYVGNPILGGISCFRAEDDTAPPNIW
jgi:hypothetical protein